MLDMQERTPRRRSFHFTPVAYWRNFSLLSMRPFFPSFYPTHLRLTCIRCFLGEAKANTSSDPVDLKPPSTDGKPKLKSIVNLLDFEVCEELTDSARLHGVMVTFTGRRREDTLGSSVWSVSISSSRSPITYRESLSSV